MYTYTYCDMYTYTYIYVHTYLACVPLFKGDIHSPISQGAAHPLLFARAPRLRQPRLVSARPAGAGGGV